MLYEVITLSDWLDLRVWREGKEHYMRFRGGVAEAPLAVVGESDKTGTEVTFMPSDEIFAITEFNFETLEHRMRELAFLNSGVYLSLTDNRHGDEPKKTEFHYEGGIEAFVKYLNRSKTVIQDLPIVVSGEVDGMSVELAMEWTTGYHETTLCFTNNIPQRDGGTHLAGFRIV